MEWITSFLRKELQVFNTIKRWMAHFFLSLLNETNYNSLTTFPIMEI